ncbi:MAG: hypothetical protein V4561_08435 [Bacteroidota bacterium]
MKNFPTIIIILGSITLFACQKKETKTIDPNKLKLNISKPSEAAVYKKDDTVFIKANASYTEQLHGYSLQISNKSNQQVHFDIDEHLHASKFDIDTFWVNSLGEQVDLLLKLTVEIDHEGNEDFKEVNFQTVL